MIRIGVIGCGQWGPNHIRIFNSMRRSCVSMVADVDPERLGAIESAYPETVLTGRFEDILNHPDVDAVVVSTPTRTHHEIVQAALDAGKHVLCEKPLCTHADEGAELSALAAARGLVLMVGHVFLFNAGVRAVKSFLVEGELGAMCYLTATRTNLGPVRQDVNVVYDLASHDISIFNYLLEASPVEVSAVGLSTLSASIQDVAFISLKYPGGVLGNIHVSWLDPKKVRQMTIVGDRRMATWDDLGTLGPVALYDKGIVKEAVRYRTFGEFQLLAREGDITIPKIKMAEPLKTQGEHFLDCLEGEASCASDGNTAVEIIKVLEAIDASLADSGRPVQLSSTGAAQASSVDRAT